MYPATPASPAGIPAAPAGATPPVTATPAAGGPLSAEERTRYNHLATVIQEGKVILGDDELNDYLALQQRAELQ